MDPSKPSSSGTSNNADLASYFMQAMRLGDASSALEHQQERYHVDMLRDQHYGATTLRHASPAPAAFQVMMSPMMQGLQAARQFWPAPEPYYSDPWSSTGGAASNGFGGQSSSQHQSDPWSYAQQQQQPWTMSASASQYQRQVAVTASQYQPSAAILTASQYYQQPGGAPDYDDSIFYQRVKAVEAAQAQAASLSRERPERRRPRTLEETRSALLSGAPMELHLVTFPDSPAHVVHLLLDTEEAGEDTERIRQSVLAGVTRRVYDFIDHREGQEVLVKLLRACAGRHADVSAIVKAAVAPSPKGRNSLLRPTKHNYWEKCVMELLTAASPFPDLRAMLVDRLLCEGLLENDRVDHLLNHVFAATKHDDIKVVVQCALKKIYALLVTSSGSKCLVDCYDRATLDQLQAFHDIMLAHATEIAMGSFSNYFMQHVLASADGQTRRLLVDRLMADVVTLSLHNFGSYVVEACYQKAGLLPRVLAAFLHLDKSRLVTLVQGEFANYVVQKLLDTAMDRFPEETMVLARRIDRLPKQLLDQDYAKKVMRVVRKIFTRYSQMYY